MTALPEFAGRIRRIDTGRGIPLQVTLRDILQQRADGWPDWHPEDFCHRCGNRNVTWATPGATWNQVMRGGDLAGWGPWGEIVCIPCFVELAERQGVVGGWHLAYDENGTTWLRHLGTTSSTPTTGERSVEPAAVTGSGRTANTGGLDSPGVGTSTTKEQS